MECDPLDELLTRLEPDFLSRRMMLQVAHFVRLFGRGRGGLHFENMDFLFPLLARLLRLTGLAERAAANVLAFKFTRQVFAVADLPAEFSGLRILHLSDLHIDCNENGLAGMGRHIARAVSGLEFDVCVITGDFRYRTHGSYGELATEMEVLAPSLRCRHGIFGILGNHDFVEQVPYLERLGVRMLLNEAVAIERAGARIWITGVDDPHYYGMDDFDRALAGIPAGSPIIALVHSPEIAVEAEKNGVSLYLSGHTHGGQLCLPGGLAVYRNARCPRAFINGRWRQGSMHGYTSAGTGSSGWPARLNCPPEIAIHELRAVG